MSARTGIQYLRGLRDYRSVWVNGEAVRDVTAHELFKGSLAGMAGYFDWQNEHAGSCLMEHEGGVASVSHLIPKSREDLARRHACLRTLARYSVGMLGRTPDYLNVTFAGFAGQPSIWRQAGNGEGYENLCAFQKEAAARDLALTHTIIHPVVDKRYRDYEGVNRQLALRKVDETADFVVVSGARILATLGPFADELAVYPAHPIPEDQPDIAIAFAVPLSSPGLKVLCRDHYGLNRNVFDHPFSSRFDEQDAFIVFDNVEVPKHRVFCNANPTVFNTAMRNGWTGNIMQQTVIRALAKLEFAYDLATRIAEVTGQQKRSEVTHMLGELWSYAELTRAALQAAEDGASDYGDGTWICDERPFYALRPTMPGWMVRVNDILKTLGSHNLLATPASADFDDDELQPILENYLAGADDIAADERARLFRTAWDMVGSALGGRMELYERFYLASAPRTYALAHMRAQQMAEWEVVPEFWRATDEIAARYDLAGGCDQQTRRYNG
ncbi:MAG: 4-hydroxyphenylacetate 3-hydroxylase [Gammaproteobacteria bacterium]|nr:4-hydroxyphenylacetate 3-hydroxylase [Gammaproteobacteria bacterium]MDE0365100.1 4-hydroxyphenylacetate 3-hydroxylase [Gammaproteobacteria bacterium]